jgi:hypothetical protein
VRADDLPILLMVPGFALALWHALREARANDAAFERGGEAAVAERMRGPAPAGATPSEAARVLTWPYLLRVELLAAIAVMAALVVWSIVLDAPLEPIADPNRTPNPSKAPWYFVGLQELLVYFDPWVAGVVLPTLVVVGLCAIPYVDRNPVGNGWYAWRSRRLAITIFLGGFVGLWLAPILIGTFFRGPGWGFFWPWEAWDEARVREAATVSWPALLGARGPLASGLVGGATVAGWYALGLVAWWRLRARPAARALGGARFAIVALLGLTMLAVPIKMALRLALSVKYVWVTPWFSL